MVVYALIYRVRYEADSLLGIYASPESIEKDLRNVTGLEPFELIEISPGFWVEKERQDCSYFIQEHTIKGITGVHNGEDQST
jgi:hypothetical protein